MYNKLLNNSIIFAVLFSKGYENADRDTAGNNKINIFSEVMSLKAQLLL